MDFTKFQGFGHAYKISIYMVWETQHRDYSGILEKNEMWLYGTREMSEDEKHQISLGAREREVARWPRHMDPYV